MYIQQHREYRIKNIYIFVENHHSQNNEKKKKNYGHTFVLNYFGTYQI